MGSTGANTGGGGGGGRRAAAGGESQITTNRNTQNANDMREWVLERNRQVSGKGRG